MNEPSQPIPAISARERVLDAAELLFREHGYQAVSLNDLASALGMRKASLYHHAPQGKEALYVEVMLRVLRRYHAGLQSAIQAGDAHFIGQLKSAADWLLSQPSLHYGRMMQADLAAIRPENARQLRAATHQALLGPLNQIFQPEMQRRGVDPARVEYLSGAFLAIIESIQMLPEAFNPAPRAEMADFVIEALFRNFGSRD